MSEQKKILKAMSRIDYLNQEYRRTLLLNRSSNYGFIESYLQEMDIILDEIRALSLDQKEQLKELDTRLDNFC